MRWKALHKIQQAPQYKESSRFKRFQHITLDYGKLILLARTPGLTGERQHGESLLEHNPV